MSKLETEFEEVVNNVLPQIKEQLRIAKEAMDKAIDLADEHGIPFQSIVSNSFHNTYVPYSFTSKYGDIKHVIHEITLGFSPTLPDDSEYGWASEAWTRSMDCMGY